MSDSPKELSPDTLERLVARALELDERSRDRISLENAREIALELGISEAAWDVAVAERVSAETATSSARANIWRRTLLSAALGFAAGAMGGSINRTFSGDLDVLYGALLVVGGLAMSARRSDEPSKAATARLDAWWLAVPAGLLIALEGIRTDPLLFAAFARWGTGWVSSHRSTLLRLFRHTESPPSASTA
jgi:hypothetical protein